jgi:ATP-dependent exoDNAse (exonuclease V) alpha subunit
VVIPFWEEIERFNVEARDALRRHGLLGDLEVVRDAVKPLSWTEEQKVHWDQYRPGDSILFVRETRYFRRGTVGKVIDVLPDGLRVQKADGHSAKLTRRQRGAFDVGRLQHLPISAGDRLLIRGRDSEHGFENGDFKQVERVDGTTNEVRLTDGSVLPPDFNAWTYGHALTSYRAQGSTAEESLIVLGEVAERALMQRQFYVGNTRYRGHHRIYVSHREPILQRLAQGDPGRELATEFLQRQNLVPAERIRMRPLRRMGVRARHVLRNVAAQWEQLRESIRAQMEL